jgi:hypothetical protein
MQTEDVLTRNMLAATAGFINCVGGVNGSWDIAVKKSLVIDLEPEVEKSNRQQGASRETVQPDRLSPETPNRVILKGDAIVESHAISMRGSRNDYPPVCLTPLRFNL